MLVLPRRRFAGGLARARPRQHPAARVAPRRGRVRPRSAARTSRSRAWRRRRPRSRTCAHDASTGGSSPGMLPPSVLGAIAGGSPPGIVPADALRIVIGTALLVFGVDLLRPRRRLVPAPRAKRDLRAAVVAGAVIGALGGLIGLILGSLRLPALIRWVGEEPAASRRDESRRRGRCRGGRARGPPARRHRLDLLGVGAAGSIPGACSARATRAASRRRRSCGRSA